jgi:surface antigen
MIFGTHCRTAFSYKNSTPASNSNASARFFNGVIVLVLGAVLSGCAVGKTMSKLESEPELITGSVTKSVEDEGIDPTDAETIKITVVDAEQAVEAKNLLSWRNPQTGNSGTISAIDSFIGTHGQSCKKFRTTVDSFMGISLYNGETCELKKGFWVLSWFIRDKNT